MPSTAADASAAVHVAAAVIVADDGRVLLSRRPDHVHQGGLWEFPGGKLEAGETVEQALARELREELGIRVTGTRPLIRVAHDYPDKSVLLDVWRVDAFTGQPHGREGQPIDWVAPAELASRAFPAANLPIVRAAQLPDRYPITPEPGEDTGGFLACLARLFAHDAPLVQLRAKALSPSAFRALAERAQDVAAAAGAGLMLNGPAELVVELGARGLHLTSAQLMACSERPLPGEYRVAASCHNAAELAHAAAIGLDFAVLAPVQPTATHPDAEPLGWERFRALTDTAPLPVYALGGLTAADLATAWRYGAQGVAGIRGFWEAA